MPISEVEGVLAKYKREEEVINSKISQRDVHYTKSDGISKSLQNKSYSKSIGQAKERNKLILKNLETVKGNLRSKAIYSPSEMQWKNIQEKYKAEPSLAVTKWRCHLPIIV